MNNADGADAQARMSYRGDSSGTGSPMGRFFFQNGGFPSGFFGMRPGGGGNFGTTTVFGTMTSTAIVANFLSCIPAVQFTSSSSVQATNPCARRKRLAAEIMDALEEAFDTPDVVPSVVAP